VIELVRRSAQSQRQHHLVDGFLPRGFDSARPLHRMGHYVGGDPEAAADALSTRVSFSHNGFHAEGAT
jgi:hypothetical protein